MQIRITEISDVAQIADFQMKMAEETENLILDFDIVVKGVTHILNNPDKGF